MTETSATQLRRILQLVPQLADGEEHPIAPLAERLGVTREVLFNDIVSLGNRFDEPGGFVAGVTLAWERERIWALTQHFLRPMRLTMRELCALELGLALVRRERTPDEWPAIDRALARLREAITKLPTNDLVEGTEHADVDVPGIQWLPVARRAVEGTRKLRLRYHAGSAEASTDRMVCPYALVFAERMWYLVAFCERGDGLRFFRLDRVEDAQITDQRFAIPEDFAVDDLLADGRLFRAEQSGTMVVCYTPRIARWIAEREGKVIDADGSLTLRHPLADSSWAMRHVLQYGPDAEVMEPAWLREKIVERLHAMSRQ